MVYRTAAGARRAGNGESKKSAPATQMVRNRATMNAKANKMRRNQSKSEVLPGTTVILGVSAIRTEEGRNPKKATDAGAPGEIRTPDLLLRRQSLYPTELRARTKNYTRAEVRI